MTSAAASGPDVQRAQPPALQKRSVITIQPQVRSEKRSETHSIAKLTTGEQKAVEIGGPHEIVSAIAMAIPPFLTAKILTIYQIPGFEWLLLQTSSSNSVNHLYHTLRYLDATARPRGKHLFLRRSFASLISVARPNRLLSAQF
jgi:hypothetical protein